MANLWGRLMDTVRYFRESSQTDQAPRRAQLGDFACYGSRHQRYTINWGHYENTAYAHGSNQLADSFKAERGLYEAIRGIYNPTYRIGEFWANYLLGGAIDPDGVEGSLPIDGPAKIRKAIGRLYKDSNWGTQKSIWARFGAIMGDAPLAVCIDPKNGRVTLVPLDPRKVHDHVLDEHGNVQAYEYRELRRHPEPGKHGDCEYMLRVSRQGESSVIYETFKDEQPFAWDERGASYAYGFGFVPLVWAQHVNNNHGAGYSEIHSALPKLTEQADQASILCDYTRQRVKTPRVLFGYDGDIETLGSKGDWINDEGDGVFTRVLARERSRQVRDEADWLTIPEPSARLESLVADMSIADAIANIAAIGSEIERDYPELALDRLWGTAQVSGEAIRLAQQPVAVKVLARRGNYDACLVRAHQMALTIGGVLGYEGYEGFTIESFAGGDLEHSIGDRPVFSVDEADRLEQETARSALYTQMITGGFPPEVALKKSGYDDETIKAVLAHHKAMQAQALAQENTDGGRAADGGDGSGDGPGQHGHIGFPAGAGAAG